MKRREDKEKRREKKERTKERGKGEERNKKKTALAGYEVLDDLEPQDRARSPKDLSPSFSVPLPQASLALAANETFSLRWIYRREFGRDIGRKSHHGGTGDSHVADPFLALIVAWSTPIPRSASAHSLQRVASLTWPRHRPREDSQPRARRDGKSTLAFRF